MATETFLKSPWLKPPAFNSKGLTNCVVLTYANNSWWHTVLSWPHILLTTCFVQINSQMAMFVVFLPAPPGSGEEEVRNSFIPQLAVSQHWVKEVPWNPVCPPSKNVKNKERHMSSVSVSFLWLTLISLQSIYPSIHPSIHSMFSIKNQAYFKRQQGAEIR